MVRLFHWSLVVVFAVAWLTAEESAFVHEWAGYIAAGLIGVRLVWGLVGSHYARFSQFLRGPSATLAYLREVVKGREARYLGHNPAGAAMIVALLLTMLATAFTGWLLENPTRIAMLPEVPSIIAPAHADEDEDDEYAERGEEGEGAIGELHEVLANLMLVLVVLHVAGVALASVRHRENLARAMVTGLKRPAEPGDVA
ncbi:MAG: cytochrome b/b6 domain-containing protein [Sediminimonas sp.]|uniref:cytochrome b/b6 domain-containing protein n=1 Tax=Sediminimonas sp. TaxID=2823379 RepID=UPI0028703E38|nr:cytochrome b/b6 domain-containing protein [Sediminimonas sp.]MDR9486353.1 cytochrome b/b6 domain-containing protein [Sediminimonas sp.]